MAAATTRTTNTWTPLPQSPLAPRAYTPAVWTGSEYDCLGRLRRLIGQMYGDGARYNPATNTWKLTSRHGAPNARYWHTAVWTGSEMIVWGGDQLPHLRPERRPLQPRHRHLDTDQPGESTLASLAARGGVDGHGDDHPRRHSGQNPVGGRYNPATDTWKATNPTNAANNGQGITAVWTGKEMIVWGGLDDNFVFHNDGGRYNPQDRPGSAPAP